MIPFVIFGLSLLLMVLTVVLWIRNEQVYRYRIDLIERVYDDRMAAIYGRPNQGLTWEMIRSVSYDSMVWQFWRPLDSFYPDVSADG